MGAVLDVVCDGAAATLLGVELELAGGGIVVETAMMGLFCTEQYPE